MLVATRALPDHRPRWSAALHLKIDELILAIGGARNEVTGLEHRTEKEIEGLRADHDDVRAAD